MAESNAQYWYVYGLSLEQVDVLASSEALQLAYGVSRNPQHLYAKCEILARNSTQPGVKPAFNRCIQQLEKVAPPDAVNQLKRMIK
jgi:hypothetical protein